MDSFPQAGQIRVEAVHERGVIPYFRWQRAGQAADALLMLHVHVEIADPHAAAIGAEALL